MITDRVLDASNPGSVAHRARARRWSELLRTFPDLADMHVLDLGGTPSAWRHVPVKPARVVTLNVDRATLAETEPRVTPVQGDACDPPPEIRAQRFDLIYSNSVLEHVGGHARRLAMAGVVAELAPHHWVQTPYRYFPVEPHWLFPGFQFLPMRVKVAVTRRWRLGYLYQPDHTPATAWEQTAWIELVGVTEMRNYFPHSRIWRERFAGLTKSLVAVR